MWYLSDKTNFSKIDATNTHGPAKSEEGTKQKNRREKT